MAYENSDNGAFLAGYTLEYIASSALCDLHISVKPEVDLDGRFTAFDHDEQEYVRIEGSQWDFAPVSAEA